MMAHFYSLKVKAFREMSNLNEFAYKLIALYFKK